MKATEAKQRFVGDMYAITNQAEEAATRKDFLVVQAEGNRQVRRYTLNRQHLEQNARELASALALVRRDGFAVRRAVL